MGALIYVGTNWAYFPIGIALSLVCNTITLLFGGLTTLLTPETELKNRVTFIFGKYSFQFGFILSIFVLGTFFTSLISLISAKNFVKRLFKWLFKYKFFCVKYFHYILVIIH